MKVLLKQDVKDLGKAGSIVNVKNGFARNFLFPKSLAVEASDKNEKALAHIQKMAEIKAKKAIGDRKQIIAKLEGVTVTFSMSASDSDKLFGSVVANDVSIKLSEMGIEVDKRDIILEPIKMVGQHKAKIDFGDDLNAEIAVVVERQQ
ncbi:MAG: 50S ribosomal protein L9 [Bdellovibrionales bacterium]